MGMTRNRALILAFVATVLLTSAVCGVLMSMRVSPTLIAVAFAVVGGAGCYLLSSIVMHYGVPERRP